LSCSHAQFDNGHFPSLNWQAWKFISPLTPKRNLRTLPLVKSIGASSK